MGPDWLGGWCSKDGRGKFASTSEPFDRLGLQPFIWPSVWAYVWAYALADQKCSKDGTPHRWRVLLRHPATEANKSLRHSDKSCSDSGIATKCTRIPAYRLPEHWQCHGTDAINRHLLRRGLGASPPAITPKGRIPPEPVNGDPARRIETFASLRANLANGARRRTLLSSEVHLPARPGAAITTSNAYSARTARPLTGRSRPWG